MEGMVDYRCNRKVVGKRLSMQDIRIFVASSKELERECNYSVRTDCCDRFFQ